MIDKFILWLGESGIEDISAVGVKNASLGELYRINAKTRINIPNGFAVTSAAYRFFLEEAGIQDRIRKLLQTINPRNISHLQDKGKKIRRLILETEFPPGIRMDILNSYSKLEQQYGAACDVAVRSSVTVDESQIDHVNRFHESFLNVTGAYALIESCKLCFASLFTNRALSYWIENKIDIMDVSQSIGIQRMVRSDLACSGVIYTIDPETGFSNSIFITASWGLGEHIAQGYPSPDEYFIFKPEIFSRGKMPIISKKIGSKETRLVYDYQGTRTTKVSPVPINDQKRFCLKDDEIMLLARWGKVVEDHYSQKRGTKIPVYLEWAKDGLTGKLYLLQVQRELIHARKDGSIILQYNLSNPGRMLAAGEAIGNRIGEGRTNIVNEVEHFQFFRKGQVLVTDMTDPDWEPIMKQASAIVTNRGGRTCHAALIARELGIPCIVGTRNATGSIISGQNVTIDCSEGEKGIVYDGLIDFKVHSLNVSKVPKTATKIMMNIGTPDLAFEKSFLPNDGVGLVRQEFVISSSIKIHPRALIEFKDIKDESIRSAIERLTVGYTDKKEYFVDKLSYGLSRIAAAFYPKEVIVRLSDFKSNEYSDLIGGHLFEPKEENPMIGFRGAVRYYTPSFKESFALECRAIRRVREIIGLENVKIMVPFCRTPEEGRRIISILAKHGLVQGRKNLQIYAMCEVPSNVILADEFCKIFDGFSIGSNDLTQLVLGVDRDSELVSAIYDERNEAVKSMIRQVVKIAKENGRKIGFSGDAPSSIPGFAEFLVGIGIDSISLTPDAVLKTKLLVARTESRLARGKPV